MTDSRPKPEKAGEGVGGVFLHPAARYVILGLLVVFAIGAIWTFVWFRGSSEDAARANWMMAVATFLYCLITALLVGVAVASARQSNHITQEAIKTAQEANRIAQEGIHNAVRPVCVAEEGKRNNDNDKDYHLDITLRNIGPGPARRVWCYARRIPEANTRDSNDIYASQAYVTIESGGGEKVPVFRDSTLSPELVQQVEGEFKAEEQRMKDNDNRNHKENLLVLTIAEDCYNDKMVPECTALRIDNLPA